jgi:hypothetical protein
MAVPTRLQRTDCGSNVYEVIQWLWQFGRGKPRLGGLTIEETSERKDVVSNARHKRPADSDQRRYVLARQPDLKYMVLYDSMYEYVRVYTSMYEYVRVCTSMYQNNQGLQIIFMICTYFLFTFGSKIQCAVLRNVSVHL